MTLIGLILTIALVGLLLWVVTTYVPMPPPIKTALVAIVVILLVIWVLQALAPGLLTMPVVVHD